ncbi:heme o synthase [soil metagenome]
MKRFQRLSLITALATFGLVILGGIVRVTDSGLGCPDWPFCYGQLIPSLGDDKAWIEWTHRTLAAVIGFLVLGVAVLGVRQRRERPGLAVLSVGALVLTGFQAWLGKVTVETGNSAGSVTAHLAAAMLLLGLLISIAVRTRYPAQLARGGTSQRFTLFVAFASASVYALLLFGSQVTVAQAGLVFTDWPLFDGQLLPRFSPVAEVAELQRVHFLHRLVAGLVGLVVVAAAWFAWRGSTVEPGPGRLRVSPTVLGLTGTAAALYLIQVIVGALQIFTQLAPWAVAVHLAMGAAIWGVLVAATVSSYCEARIGRAAEVQADAEADAGADAAPGTIAGTSGTRAAKHSRGETVHAYVALTKPRIIELLLVTTVPAMVLAARGVPRLDLVLWTLVGGSLAAGAANAINCYLDRDIDLLMTRTRRRPLPAHQVEPENALVFGLVLSVLAFAELAILVNLLAAYLALLAIGFYVVVYTMLLKRSTPHNIVIGGAAGSLPPVIGWAAVTGDITLPALLLFAIVFYWTPPHFWALSLRLAKDYRAAGVPMLPVVRGVPETTRQIGLYSLLMVALTLVFFSVAQMRLLYLAGALLLGAVFLYQALAMWRERTEARAIRLYKYSISYLAALFAVMVVDVMVPIGL